MSKMSNLDSMLKELRKNAQSVLELADALEKEFSSTEESTPKKKSSTKQEATPTDAEPTVESKPKKEISLSDIKTVLMQKSRDGYDAQVHELIKSYGVPKLSAIDKSFYPELLKKAEVIGNA